jgi:predicted XRE-type DNA-binding protein
VTGKKWRFVIVRQSWRKRVATALLIVVGGVAVVAQACGGGSTATKATPTAKPLPSRSAQGTPRFRGGTPPADFTPLAGAGNGTFPGGTPPADFTPPAGIGDRALLGGFDPALAQFFGISEEQLQSELAAEGATIGTVAEAHGKTRDELKDFLIQQIRTNADQAVADGRMTQDQADTMVQNSSSRVDDMIDGKIPSAGRPAPPSEPGQ